MIDYFDEEIFIEDISGDDDWHGFEMLWLLNITSIFNSSYVLPKDMHCAMLVEISNDIDACHMADNITLIANIELILKQQHNQRKTHEQTWSIKLKFVCNTSAFSHKCIILIYH